MLLIAAALAAPLALHAEGLQVTEAHLGKGVQDRKIVDEGSEFVLNDKVFLLVKIAGGPADVKVNWKHGDKADSFPLKVGGNPWRTFASRTMHQTGDWTVNVTDDKDQVLKEMKFTV
jgi:hypothetical protein